MKKILKKLRWFAGHHSYKWVVRDWVKINDLDLCAKVLTTDRFRNNLETQLIESPGNKKKIVVIAPHQDDETIGAGGTLIKSADNGAKISCIYITDGSRASDKVTPENMRKTREEEAKIVWNAIGGKPIFLRFRDGNTPITKEAAHTLAERINREKPDIIFIPFLLDNHPEHRRTNHLFWFAKNELIMKKIEIWAYQVWSGLIPNVAVDITSVIERKNSINRLWKSQNILRNFEFFSQSLNGYNSKFINTNKSPCYLEIFFVVPKEEYFDLCEIYFSKPLK